MASEGEDVARERQRREIEPITTLLKKLLEDTKDIKSSEAKAFRKQIRELEEFTTLGSKVMKKFAGMGQGTLLKWSLKFLK